MIMNRFSASILPVIAVFCLSLLCTGDTATARDIQGIARPLNYDALLQQRRRMDNLNEAKVQQYFHHGTASTLHFPHLGVLDHRLALSTLKSEVSEDGNSLIWFIEHYRLRDRAAELLSHNEHAQRLITLMKDHWPGLKMTTVTFADRVLRWFLDDYKTIRSSLWSSDDDYALGEYVRSKMMLAWNRMVRDADRVYDRAEPQPGDPEGFAGQANDLLYSMEDFFLAYGRQTRLMLDTTKRARFSRPIDRDITPYPYATKDSEGMITYHPSAGYDEAEGREVLKEEHRKAERQKEEEGI